MAQEKRENKGDALGEKVIRRNPARVVLTDKKRERKGILPRAGAAGRVTEEPRREGGKEVNGSVPEAVTILSFFFQDPPLKLVGGAYNVPKREKRKKKHDYGMVWSKTLPHYYKLASHRGKRSPSPGEEEKGIRITRRGGRYLSPCGSG